MAKVSKEKHKAHIKKLRDDVEAELGKYRDGGPAVVVTRSEWDGLTKTLDNATDEELGAISSIVIHVQ